MNNTRSRLNNVSRNFIYSIMAQMLNLVLGLISRMVFVKVLGVSYLGISGLFNNIVTVLSLAELGIGEAIIYSMYKPLADNDYDRISSLITFYKEVYCFIAIIVSILGFVLYFFLDFFINLDVEIVGVKKYYICMLVQSIASYLLVYKTVIFTADQKNYFLTKISMVGSFIAMALQIVALLLWKSYGLYIAIGIVVGISVNVINSHFAVVKYPYIAKRIHLDTEEKKVIFSNVKSMFAYKLGGVALNSTDNILISKIVSTVILGFYSNYTLIFDKVTGFVRLIFISLQASLGNYNASCNSEEMYFMFRIISLIEYWVYSFCSLCFCLLVNDFIELWLGKEYVLSLNIVLVCVFNFYLKGVLYPIWCFRNTTGLFKDTRYMMFWAAGINIVLSIVLGIRFGLVGILLSTALARLLTNIWYEPRILFKKYFLQNVSAYYLIEIYRFLQLVAICLSSLAICNLFDINNLYLKLIVKLLFSIVVCIGLFLLEESNKVEYIYLKKRAISILNKKKIDG